MTKNSDKIFVNTEDSEDLAAAIAKLEPGDSVQFKGSATLDEDSGGVAALSIVEFNIVQSGDKKKTSKANKPSDDAEETDTPTEDALAEQGQDDEPAVQLAKRRNSGDMGA